MEKERKNEREWTGMGHYRQQPASVSHRLGWGWGAKCKKELVRGLKRNHSVAGCRKTKLEKMFMHRFDLGKVKQNL